MYTKSVEISWEIFRNKIYSRRRKQEIFPKIFNGLYKYMAAVM